MIDDSPTYARSSHEATVGEAVKFVAVGIGPLPLLASPVRRGGSSAVEDAVEVSSNHISIIVEISIDDVALVRKDACICDENVQAAVEIVDDCVDRVLDLLSVGDVDLVGLA